MVMLKEETFLFNPFNIEKATEQDIADTYSKLQERIIEDADTPFLVSQNIEIYANMCYLLGEVIARITEQYELLKTEIGIEENQALYSFRNQWIRDNDERPPAISYFEAMARQTVQIKYEELAKLNARLYRFKRAYESTTEKINALKFKIKSIQYENGGL